MDIDLIPPTFASELVERCRADRYTMPLVFEWYKYTFKIAVTSASVLGTVRAEGLSDRYFLVTRALLLRTARFMRAVLELAEKKRYGEVLPVLTRSLSESAIKLGWLAKVKREDLLARYMADGLKVELELQKIISRDIQEAGKSSPIQRHILDSIARTFALTGVTEDEARQSKQLHDTATMCQTFLGDRLPYVTAYKLASHAVHADSVDILFHHIVPDEETGELSPNYDSLFPDEEHLRGGAIIVLNSVSAFLDLIDPSRADTDFLHESLRMADTGLRETLRMRYGDEFQAG